MKCEIGQKVETPLGVGVVVDILIRKDKTIKEYKVCTNKLFNWVAVEDIKPYKTPHERLLEMGYELVEYGHYKVYRHDKLSDVRVYDDNTISCNDIDLELSRILTQYLEELNEK